MNKYDETTSCVSCACIIDCFSGVTSRLEYLKGLGVGIISLSPFYEHEQSENEFSVLNHTVIDSHYGTMDDFQELVTEIHNLGKSQFWPI